jgi:predicted site-specific integrase-resolvase
MNERWLKTGVAAQVLGVSAVTIRTWCNEGKLKCMLLSNKRRKILVSDLFEMAEQYGMNVDRSILSSKRATV